MRAVLVGGPGQVTVIDPPDPTPGPGGEVIVEVSSCGRCGRCGTGPHALGGQLPSPYRALVLGRESAGHVVAQGAGATGPPVGTRVAGDPDTPCDTCHDCRTGRDDLWRDYRADGLMNRFRSTTDPLAAGLAPAPQVGASSTLDGFEKAVAAVRTGTGRTISVAPTEVAQA
ncbi:alcohol dehydrogenase catalytic domain-containing protein [Streptomyces sp. NPDC093589]|uniref:alcohol dehydrogenase catalytic domain-containing protein n=1 Tax=Streptomyces sp. NPDC093589 TaxID=3366043 RepID=UPI00381C0CD5